jgi:hypothetical protein
MPISGALMPHGHGCRSTSVERFRSFDNGWDRPASVQAGPRAAMEILANWSMDGIFRFPVYARAPPAAHARPTPMTVALACSPISHYSGNDRCSRTASRNLATCSTSQTAIGGRAPVARHSFAARGSRPPPPARPGGRRSRHAALVEPNPDGGPHSGRCAAPRALGTQLPAGFRRHACAPRKHRPVAGSGHHFHNPPRVKRTSVRCVTSVCQIVSQCRPRSHPGSSPPVSRSSTFNTHEGSIPEG